MSVAGHVVRSRCSCCGQARVAYWNPQKMVAALQGEVKQTGLFPRAFDWRHGTPEHPPTSYVLKVFGCWSNFYRAAGYEPRKCGTVPWTCDDIANALLDHLVRHGRWPSSAEWSRAMVPGEPKRPHYHTVLAHFPTWDDAKRYAGWDGSSQSPAKARAQRRVARGCAGCGSALNEFSRGCSSCRSRRSKRAQRAQLAPHTKRGPVVNSLPLGASAGAPAGAATQPTNGGHR